MAQTRAEALEKRSDALWGRYRFRFADKPRATRDMAEIERILAEAKALVGEAKTLGPEATELRVTLDERAKHYALEREAIAEARAATGSGEDAELWLRRFRARDPGLCVLYGVDVWPDDDSADEPERQDLTVWADGEAQLELQLGNERSTLSGAIRSGVLDVLFSALGRTGFPDVGGSKPAKDESVIELTAYQDDTQATALLGRRALSRSEPYREVSELLRAIAAELQA